MSPGKGQLGAIERTNVLPSPSPRGERFAMGLRGECEPCQAPTARGIRRDSTCGVAKWPWSLRMDRGRALWPWVVPLWPWSCRYGQWSCVYGPLVVRVWSAEGNAAADEAGKTPTNRFRPRFAFLHGVTDLSVRTRRTTAIAAAKIRCSILTTVIPAAQLESIPNNAVIPERETP